MEEGGGSDKVRPPQDYVLIPTVAKFFPPAGLRTVDRFLPPEKLLAVTNSSGVTLGLGKRRLGGGGDSV